MNFENITFTVEAGIARLPFPYHHPELGAALDHPEGEQQEQEPEQAGVNQRDMHHQDTPLSLNPNVRHVGHRMRTAIMPARDR
jgi:hypothetical protein